MELDVKVILKQLLFIQVYVLFCNDTIWMFFGTALSFFETLFESAPINRQTNQYLTAHLKE
jgi:hypothetical protein